MNGELVIDVRDLNKHFGDKHVVRNVSLQVRRGEIFGFLGPNGSGKTTTIRMVCGLLTPDAGTGTCLGFDIRRESAKIKRQAGYMTQKFSYWDDLTIRFLFFAPNVRGQTEPRFGGDSLHPLVRLNIFNAWLSFLVNRFAIELQPPLMPKNMPRRR